MKILVIIIYYYSVCNNININVLMCNINNMCVILMKILLLLIIVM